jgi:hypothetical protein
MCEDFPCCGHEQGCCPTFIGGKQVNMRCTCGASVPLSSHSSICRDCRQAMQDQFDDCDDDDDSDDSGDYCHYCDGWEGDGCGCGEPNEGCCD